MIHLAFAVFAKKKLSINFIFIRIKKKYFKQVLYNIGLILILLDILKCTPVVLLNAHKESAHQLFHLLAVFELNAIALYYKLSIVMIYGKSCGLDLRGEEMKCKIAVYWLAHLDRFHVYE